MATYRSCIVTSLRILGLLEPLELDPEGKGRQALLRVQQALFHRPFAGTSEHRALLINDCVVMATPLDSQSYAGSFGKAIYALLVELMSGQLGLSTQDGIWIQGAIAIGEVLLGRDSLYGPGILKAKRLQAVARRPRILVDLPTVRHLNSLSSHNDSFAKEASRLMSVCLRKSTSGHWFTDYLAVMGLAKSPVPPYEKLLSEHKERIESRLRHVLRTDIRHRQFAWLARYHNRTVRAYGRRTGAVTAHLLIPTAQPLDLLP